MSPIILHGKPYLSVVAAARNDDHGANMLRRLQTFTNALLAQAARYNVPMELVLVEWNPPADRPPLAQAVQFPAGGPCRVRIVTVPPELHARYGHAAELPLYQMIAKNAGIRRAAGEYILATNIDILLSNELWRFLAERRLEVGRMYRLDRYDAGDEVPVDGSPDEQLTYCRSHLLRVNGRDGTFPVTPEGLRETKIVDILKPEDGISPGAGWHAPVQRFGQVSRTMTPPAEIMVHPSETVRTLELEVDQSALECRLRYMGTGALIEQRCVLRLRVPEGMSKIELDGMGEASVYRCEWSSVEMAEHDYLDVSRAPRRPAERAWEIATRGSRHLWDWSRGKVPGRIGSPLSPRLKALIGAPQSKHTLPADLHTNACGDFTLAHRQHWMELRGYPEFDLYSMNLDSVFCYMAHYGGAVEQVLTDPMRIYHIEHASGSGWTPEGQALLFERLKAKGIPWLEWDRVLAWAVQMEELGTTMIFNREDWGLGNHELIETLI